MLLLPADTSISMQVSTSTREDLMLEIVQTRPNGKQRFFDRLHAHAPRSLRIPLRFER